MLIALKRFRRRGVAAALAAAGALLVSATAAAQHSASQAAADTVVLSVGDALARALHESEEIRLATERVREAGDQVAGARSGLFPQLSGQFGYTRTLRSPFSGGGGGFSLPDSLQFEPDTLAALQERVRYLEKNAGAAGLGAIGSLFSGLPFGQEHTYVATLGIRQTVFDPKLFAGLRIAEEFKRLNSAQATEAGLDLALEVIEAYYNAALADRLAEIALANAAQLNAQLSQVRLVRAAGNASDLDVLRVQVERENIEPERIAALNQRDLALLNLKRLVNIEIEQPIRLADKLEGNIGAPVSRSALDAITSVAIGRRASIDAAERQVAIRTQEVRLAKAAYLPSLSLTASFGKQALPSGFVPSGADFKDDWNIGAAVQIPLFDGGQRRANVSGAETRRRQAELQLAQLKEAVALDVAQQRSELERAAALIQARARTTEQAETVYQLTRLAYDRGLQTSLQLSDARLQQQRAQANEAQALHAYYLALARLFRAVGEPAGDLLPGAAVRRVTNP